MENISGVVENTVLSFNGKSFLIDNIGFDDWAAFQSTVIAERNARLLKTVYAAKTIVDSAAFSDMKADAMSLVASTITIPDSQWDAIISSPEGIALIAWIAIERRYPGKCNRGELESFLRNTETDESGKFAASMVIFTQQILALAGFNVSKKANGQNNGATNQDGAASLPQTT